MMIPVEQHHILNCARDSEILGSTIFCHGEGVTQIYLVLFIMVLATSYFGKYRCEVSSHNKSIVITYNTMFVITCAE
jgi:hypothetical protein